MKIYLAGKIAKNDWRHTIVRGLRNWEHDLLSSTQNVANLWEWPIWPKVIFELYDYAGPYFISCDHGCYHGSGSHGYDNSGCQSCGEYDRPQILALCIHAIRNCDIFFAWIDTTDCYGTIAEIGYARSLGKQILIAGPLRSDDMWFAYQMADEVCFDCQEPVKALRKMLGLTRTSVALSDDSVLQSIADTVSDYRKGEVPTITPEHIERWVNQFPEESQSIILREMDHILKRYYMSRELARQLLENLIEADEFFGTNPPTILRRTKFLSIQGKGNSQNELLSLIAEIIQTKYGLLLNECGEKPQQYIYLDDGLFSGNTARHDCSEWLPNAVEGTTLHFIFFVTHTSGLSYFKRATTLAARKHGVSTKYWAFLKLNDRNENVESFWPGEFTGDYLVDAYIGEIRQRCNGKNYSPRLFRPNLIPQEEVVFSSPEARNIVEHAFLKAGVYILSLPENNQRSMRPLGYEFLESLGFGSFFISYRNIPNNCPLALWWGDPDESPSHPLSKWYPLFLRKTNSPAADDPWSLIC